MEAEVNEIRELVDLPDPAVRPLVHPLDVPEASRPFRTSWLIGALTSPAFGLCVAAIIWFGAGNWVVQAAPLPRGRAATRAVRAARCRRRHRVHGRRP
jgi:hypothetical protein